MLAKLKILRQEDKALQEIETKLRAQLNRLKQEERVLRRQMRRTHGEDVGETDVAEKAQIPLNEPEEVEPEPHVDDDELINQEPLTDLDDEATAILQRCQAQFVEERYVSEEEEEEDEGENGEMNNEDMVEEDEEEDELGAQYRKLFQEMQAEVDDEEEFDDD